jgi:drug/metabolite transporter (DMT)-like permease/prolyl-tRNA editing enzyme YbaK/EbsC (Cys-tRNA(Pro) deacylase)
MVICGSVFFAVNGTISKLVLRTGIDSAQLTTVRATGAAIGLVLLTVLVRPARLKVTRRELPLLITYGVAGFFFVPMLYFVAIGRLPVGVGLLFEYTAPLLVALWARFVQGQAVKPRLWIGLVASLVGLAGVAELIRVGPGLHVALDRHLRLDGLGVAAGLAAAVMLAIYYLLGTRGVTGRDSLSLTAYAFGLAALVGSIVRPWWNFDYGRLAVTGDFGVPVWLLVGYVVIGGSIVPYLLLAGAMRHLPATSVGIIGMVEPVVASTVAWLTLHEQLNAGQLGGGALILAGVALAETARVAPQNKKTLQDKKTPQEEKTPQDETPQDEKTPRNGAAEGCRQDRSMQLHSNAQAVQDALDGAGATDASGQPCQVRVLTDPVHTAAAAAAAVDVEVGQIANSLIFTTDGGHPLLVLTSGAHRVDTTKVATLLGLGSVKRANADFVRQHTGQVIGGVSPLGHPKPVQTLVDTALAQYDEIWAAGGIPQAVFPITYAELVRITAGVPAEVA